MRTITIAISLLCFGWLKSYSQAWVWEKPINTTNNSIATDPNHNIIVLSKNGSLTQLSKFTKDGTLIWSNGLKKAGSFTPSGTVVVDKTGNIYTFTEGFDSVNSVFTGIKSRGITKFDPQGNALWHVPFDHNQNPLSPDTKLPLQLDESNNVYVGYSVTMTSTTVTVRLGNLTTTVIPSNAYLAIGSISPNGTPRWVRAFRFNQQPLIGLTSTTGFSVAGNKIFISGSMGKYYLYLDNGLTLFADRCTAWLAAFNCSNGQSIWGKVHQLIYYCNGTICNCSNPYVLADPVAGKVALTNNLNGAFEFQPFDTIASIMNFGLPTVKTYYTIYDTLGNPVKGKTIETVPNQGQYKEILAGSRNNFFFVHFSNSNPTPGFGDTLRKLDTGFNLIWRVTLPPAMEKIFIPLNSNDIIATYTRAGVVYLAKMVDSAAVISGRTYADWNNDGIYTSADSALSNMLITSNSPLVNSISGNDTGKYYMYAAPGSYALNANFNHPYYQFLPTTHTATITLLSDSVKGKDFRLSPLFPFTDVSVSFSALSVARPGSNASYNVTAKNTGATTTSIDVGLKLPPLTSYNSIAGGSVTINAPDSITIAMGSIDPFVTKTATLSLNIATTATINDTLRYYSKVYPYITDTIKQDNTDTLIQAVRTSFDPNEKEVNLTVQPLADTSKYLLYTIHFQNSGNDTAFYVRIADTLSPRLNLTTFNFIDASHLVRTEIKNNIINFIFNPITLPDSTINEQQSHGFVKFKIKPVTPFNPADTIFNKAGIYFDYNAPVITNDTKSWYFTGPVVPVILKSFVSEKKSTSVLLKFATATEADLKYFIIERSIDGINFTAIGTVLSKGSTSTGASYIFEDLSPAKEINFYRLKMVDIDQKFVYSWILIVRFSSNELQHITVFPNPVNDNLYITFRNINDPKTISCRLLDASGRTVWATHVNSNARDTYSINTSSLPNGIYFITATNSNTNYQYKVVVKH